MTERRPAIRRPGRTFTMWVAGALVAVAAVTLAGLIAPRGLPAGTAILGLHIGALNALVALGLVLVYRAGRYVNFAQGSIGAAGAVIAGKLIANNGVNYYLAITIGIVASALLAGAAEMSFIKRLFKAPRLVVTVATIGLAQLFGGLEVAAATFWTDPLASRPNLDSPISASYQVGETVFRGEHIAIMVVVPLVLVGLGAFFRYSSYGAAVQAAAENPDRARLLGISVRRVSSLVWVIAGFLAGITAILQAPLLGFSFGSVSGPAMLLRGLAPAMLGGMTSLVGAVVAALGLGVVEQAVVWNSSRTGVVDLVLFLAIVAALVIRRQRTTRAAASEEHSFMASATVRPIPRELRNRVTIRVGRAATKVALLGFALLIPLPLSFSQRNLASLVVIYAIAALSLTLLAGHAGQVSFGHWAFVGFGALLGGHLVAVRGMYVLPAALVVCALGAVVAVGIGLPALRIRGLFLGVVTLAFALACNGYFFGLSWFQFPGFIRRPVLGGVDFNDDLAFYYLCLGLLVVTAWVMRNIRAGRWGRHMVSVRDNDRAAATFGVGAVGPRLLAFACSGFFGALAGYLYLLHETTLTSTAFPVETSLLLFSAVVIGGLGTVTGGVIAALYLRGIQYFAPELQLLSTSLGVLIVLIFFPGGLGGLLFSARDMVLRVLSRRWRIHVPSLTADRRIGGGEEVEVRTADVRLDRPLEAAV